MHNFKLDNNFWYSIIISIMAHQFVENEIKSQRVVIFSKSTCPYCRMAKEVFDSLNEPYKTIELDQRSDMNEIQDVLGEITGARTVPRVFVDEKFIGGGTDVKKAAKTGELQKLLQK